MPEIRRIICKASHYRGILWSIRPTDQLSGKMYRNDQADPTSQPDSMSQNNPLPVRNGNERWPCITSLWALNAVSGMHDRINTLPTCWQKDYRPDHQDGSQTEFWI